MRKDLKDILRKINPLSIELLDKLSSVLGEKLWLLLGQRCSVVSRQVKRVIGTRYKLVALLLVVLLPTLAQAKTLEGKVVRIADGDTLTLLTDSKTQIKVRLHGIDTPERKQPFGKGAKDALSAMVAGKRVRVEVTDKDRYGRTVGRIIGEGNRDINAELVRQGFAWWYRSMHQVTLSLSG